MRRVLLASFLLLSTLGARAQEIPDEPGPVWDPEASLLEKDRKVIAGAAEQAARTSGEKFLVVLSRPSVPAGRNIILELKGTFPDRNLFIASPPMVELRPTSTAAARLPREAVTAFETRIVNRMTDPSFAQAVANVVTDYGNTLAGHPPPPWKAWRHPRVAMGGGQDATPVNLFLFLAICIVVAIALGILLLLIITNPMGTLVWIGLQVLGGGGGEGSSSSFSGGGGDSGGGGANGSW